jgi:hypothetical protein
MLLIKSHHQYALKDNYKNQIKSQTIDRPHCFEQNSVMENSYSCWSIDEPFALKRGAVWDIIAIPFLTVSHCID